MLDTLASSVLHVTLAARSNNTVLVCFGLTFKICLQVFGDETQPQARAQSILARHDLALEHKICNGCLPVALVQSATILGTPALQGPAGSSCKVDVTCSTAKEAQRTVLLPVLQQLKTGLQHCTLSCMKLQELGTSDALVDAVLVCLSGQAKIVDSALQQFAQ